VIVAMSLCACGKRADEAASGSARHGHGRYIGVGLYPAGQMWPQIAGAAPSKDPASAGLKDDEEVIVVLDANTGELRQCGNLSGYCVGMNPSARPLGASQGAPLLLVKHAARLQAETRAASKRP
jgi:hypothetical protein